MNRPLIVLASNSPRRREILSWTGDEFSRATAEIDETPLPGETPEDYVLRLAREKARVSANQAPFDGLVLAADTTVADLGKIIGKPADREDARRILLQLRNRTHDVHTAIVLVNPSKGISREDLCSTRVKMRAYSDEEIEGYLDSGDPMDKAGAYGIQNESFNPVAKMTGCFASVMGLPLCHLERMLRKLGYKAHEEVPFRCQNELAYTCPIFKRVLAGEDIG
jgi:MAF protein